MFGKNKNEAKSPVQTFVDGKPSESIIPVYPGRDDLLEQPQTVPDSVPALEEPVVQQIPEGVECVVCFDFGFYADNMGVWHNCPRCNPKELEKTETAKPVAKKKGAKQ